MNPSFSVKLQEIIDSGKHTIYGLAQKTGIDRSNIHKVLSGERAPSAMFVLRLLDTLELTDKEKNDLIFGYAEASILENDVQEQLIIQEIFGKLTPKSSHQPFRPSKKTITDSTVVIGESQIFALMTQVISELNSQDTIYTTIPFLNRSTFLDLLWDSFVERKLKIKHLLRFSGKSVIDLEILSNLLPFVVSEHRGYSVDCFYGSPTLFSAPSPFYFLTDNCVVCFSAEMNSAIVHQKTEVIDFFRSSFNADVGQAEKLFEVYADGINNLIGYKEVEDRVTYSLTYSPCFARVYTKEIVQSKIKLDIPHRDAIVEATIEYLTKTDHAEHEMQMVALDGFELFMQKGRLTILPDDYVNAFTIDERKELLLMLLEQQKNGLSIRIINPNKLHIPPGLFIAMNDLGRICFHFVHPKDKSIQCLVLEETKLSRSMKTFLTNTERRGFVFNEKETMDIINGYLK